MQQSEPVLCICTYKVAVAAVGTIVSNSYMVIKSKSTNFPNPINHSREIFLFIQCSQPTLDTVCNETNQLRIVCISGEKSLVIANIRRMFIQALTIAYEQFPSSEIYVHFNMRSKVRSRF